MQLLSSNADGGGALRESYMKATLFANNHVHCNNHQC
jgi:hypothetical protein